MTLAKSQEEAIEQEQKYYNDNINKSDDRTDLVVVTYYRQPLTDMCLAHLLARTRTPYRLTVVDNGSKDETVPFLLRLKQQGFIDNLILLDRNYGLEYARNTALRHLHGEYVVYFDNDLLVPQLEPDWLSSQLDIARRNPAFGCIALRPQILVGPPNDLWDTEEEVVEFRHVGATFMMFKRELIDEVRWDDKFTSRMADWRLGDLLKEKGLKMGWAKDIFCHHVFGKNWSYPEEVEHFHREIWPPAESYDNIEVDPLTLVPVEK